MTDTKRGRQGHDQVSSNGDGGERRERDGQEESDDASEGWIGKSAEDSEGLETEEEGMMAGGPRGEGGHRQQRHEARKILARER